GMSDRCKAASMALIGSVEKYAAGPLRSTGTSMGCAPALSGMRASITLRATRSSEMPARPPARPKAMASRGRATRKVRRKAGSAAPNSVGNSTATTRCPAMRLPSSARTACQDGFSASPSNGVKPVSRTVGKDLVIGSKPEHEEIHQEQVDDQQRRTGLPLRTDHRRLVRQLQ